jgi:hypothetical protein
MKMMINYLLPAPFAIDPAKTGSLGGRQVMKI